MEQFSIFSERASIGGCDSCLCCTCLKKMSDRCPNGVCYDDKRSDTAHRCRSGIFYPQHVCSDYVHYEGCTVKECLLANVQVFQDGYILCSIIDAVGCEECYRRFENNT